MYQKVEDFNTPSLKLSAIWSDIKKNDTPYTIASLHEMLNLIQQNTTFLPDSELDLIRRYYIRACTFIENVFSGETKESLLKLFAPVLATKLIVIANDLAADTQTQVSINYQLILDFFKEVCSDDFKYQVYKSIRKIDVSSLPVDVKKINIDLTALEVFNRISPEFIERYKVEILSDQKMLRKEYYKSVTYCKFGFSLTNSCLLMHDDSYTWWAEHFLQLFIDEFKNRAATEKLHGNLKEAVEYYQILLEEIPRFLQTKTQVVTPLCFDKYYLYLQLLYDLTVTAFAYGEDLLKNKDYDGAIGYFNLSKRTYAKSYTQHRHDASNFDEREKIAEAIIKWRRACDDRISEAFSYLQDLKKSRNVFGFKFNVHRPIAVRVVDEPETLLSLKKNV